MLLCRERINKARLRFLPTLLVAVWGGRFIGGGGGTSIQTLPPRKETVPAAQWVVTLSLADGVSRDSELRSRGLAYYLIVKLSPGFHSNNDACTPPLQKGINQITSGDEFYDNRSMTGLLPPPSFLSQRFVPSRLKSSFTVANFQAGGCFRA